MIKISLKKSALRAAKWKEHKGEEYLDVVLVDKKTEYNDGFAAADVSKEERLAGKRGEIVGNWKVLGGAKPQGEHPARQRQQSQDPDL